MKSPVLAAFLSFILPGLGQIYNGDATVALCFLVAYIFLWLVVGSGFSYFIQLIVIVPAVVEAFMKSRKLNKEEQDYVNN